MNSWLNTLDDTDFGETDYSPLYCTEVFRYKDAF